MKRLHSLASVVSLSVVLGVSLGSGLLRAQSVADSVSAPGELISRTPTNPDLPSIFIVSDSTADFHPDRDHEGAAAIQGWGAFFPAFFDLTKVNVVNVARGGRSSRTYITEGLWDHVLSQVKEHDIVLIQLGQNDVFEINDQTARGTIPGIGDESQDIDNKATHLHETVHTFGWYLRKYVRDTRSKGAMPIVMSLTTRNVWKDGQVEIGVSGYRGWSRTIAEHEHSDFVDVSAVLAREYEKLGQAKVAGLFHAKEPVHMTTPGAFLAAQCVVSGLKALLDRPVTRYLSNLGNEVPPADELAFKWPANRNLPTLWILGDSTVRNGDGLGVNGLWGWGDELAPFFDQTKLNISNVAISGISSRTYYTLHWPLLLPNLRKGDFLLIQFGHNDGGVPEDKSRSRASLPGIGEESKEILNPITGKHEVVHTYGWYMRQIIEEAKKKGTTPIICSPVPRNAWIDQKIKPDEYGAWSAEVAKLGQVPFVDLHRIIATQYEHMGKQKVTSLFGDAVVHATLDGAKLNAESLITGLKALSVNPLGDDVLP
jgi:lysophospholipase L1-like esterase